MDVTATRTFLQHAFFYASKGWRIFPIAPRKKNPPLVKWADEATTDDRKIAGWWEVTPTANIGIACGRTSGIVVLDVDPAHGGDDSLHALIQQYGRLPDTPESITGSGGRHILFAHPGVEIHNSAGKLGAGLDIRGDGGYIVAPPSIHPSGRQYQWEPMSRPSQVQLAPMPAWLLDMLTRGAQPVTDKFTDAEVGGEVIEGGRNEYMTSLGGAMRRRGMGFDAIFAGLMAENNARCQPPLSADEISAIAKSITRYKPAEPTRVMSRPVYGQSSKIESREPSTAFDGVMALLDLMDNLDGRSIPTFITPIDDALGGIERQTLTVLAARPSMGKSTLAWQIALNNSAHGLRSYFFSLEMSTVALWAKVACGAAGVRWRDIRSQKATPEQVARVMDEAMRLMNLHEDRILVDDGVNTTETMWQMIDKHRPDIVVVDHLRLVADDSENETRRLGAITKTLKDAAKAFNCAVVCLAQLNREVEKRDDKRPQLSDLRDSGQIEENADLVLMMYREDYYDDETRAPAQAASLTELLIRKFRDDVAAQRIYLTFDMKRQWFGGK